MNVARKLFSIGILLLLLAACGGGNNDAEPTAAPTAVAAANPTAAPVEPTAAAVEPTDAPVEPTAAPADATAAPEEPTAAPEAAQAAAPSGDAAYDAVMSAIRAQFSGGPYRAVATTETSGTTTQMTSEVIPPDNMHIVITADAVNTEMILVGDALWTKTGDGEWTEMPGGAMVQGMIDSMLANADSSLVSNVQLVGPESVDGEAATVYTYSSSIGEGEQAVTSENKLWISDASGLPIKLESNGSAMGVTSHIVQTIEYDDSITIEAPVQ